MSPREQIEHLIRQDAEIDTEDTIFPSFTAPLNAEKEIKPKGK